MGTLGLWINKKKKTLKNYCTIAKQKEIFTGYTENRLYIFQCQFFMQTMFKSSSEN